jgi:hypothetical protein
MKDMETSLTILFKDKILVEEERIIKVNPADQFDSMMTPLAHAPDGWNSHREEEKPLRPFRTFCNSPGIKDALRSAILVREGFENTVRE